MEGEFAGVQDHSWLHCASGKYLRLGLGLKGLILVLISCMQICIFGTIANIFNVIVLTRKEMAKAPINIILKWLAVTDIFVMLEYIPFSIYMYLIFPSKCNSMTSSELLNFDNHLASTLKEITAYIKFNVFPFPDRRDFQYGWAVYLLFHMHFTQVLHTISISLTVTLAIWRYIAIK